MTGMMFWLFVAYVSFAAAIILAVVTLGALRSLRSDAWRVSVAEATRELRMTDAQDGLGSHPMCRCVVVAPGDEDDWLVPDASDAEPWGALFSAEQQVALEALRHSPLVTARRRAMTADVETR